MMGNNNHVMLFTNKEEKRNMDNILNAAVWWQQEVMDGSAANINIRNMAKTLVRILRDRMWDLEAETCRGLSYGRTRSTIC